VAERETSNWIKWPCTTTGRTPGIPRSSEEVRGVRTTGACMTRPCGTVDAAVVAVFARLRRFHAVITRTRGDDIARADVREIFFSRGNNQTRQWTVINPYDKYVCNSTSVLSLYTLVYIRYNDIIRGRRQRNRPDIACTRVPTTVTNNIPTA